MNYKILFLLFIIADQSNIWAADPAAEGLRVFGGLPPELQAYTASFVRAPGNFIPGNVTPDFSNIIRSFIRPMANIDVQGNVKKIEFSPDSTKILVLETNISLFVYDIATKTQSEGILLDLDNDTFSYEQEKIDACFVNGGSDIATTMKDTITILDSNTLQKKSELPKPYPHDHFVRLAWNTTAQMLIVLDNASLDIWNLKTNELVMHKKLLDDVATSVPGCLSITKDGALFALMLAKPDGRSINIYNTLDGNKIQTLTNVADLHHECG